MVRIPYLSHENSCHRKIRNSIYIFFYHQRIDNPVLVQMLRKRSEQQNAMNFIILIYLTDRL